MERLFRDPIYEQTLFRSQPSNLADTTLHLSHSYKTSIIIHYLGIMHVLIMDSYTLPHISLFTQITHAYFTHALARTFWWPLRLYLPVGRAHDIIMPLPQGGLFCSLMNSREPKWSTRLLGTMSPVGRASQSSSNVMLACPSAWLTETFPAFGV